MQLSVIIPTHNPHVGRLRQTLAGLKKQSLPSADWETIVIDNGSSLAITADAIRDVAPDNVRVVTEPELGLTAARRRGLAEARGAFAVLVDDDNVLAPDYLVEVLRLFREHPKVGALGGKCIPDFEQPPPAWVQEFYGLLALRDLGTTPQISNGLRPNNTPYNEYPLFAPMGAGMALRREAWEAWEQLCQTRRTSPSDRKGDVLSSSGDNDLVLAVLRAGWEVAYCPELSLTHLIPTSRLDPKYLARLNRAIQNSWQQVLRLHDANPWPELTRLGAALRIAKAWFVHRPWTSPAAAVRWQGACGHFEGRIHNQSP